MTHPAHSHADPTGITLGRDTRACNPPKCKKMLVVNGGYCSHRKLDSQLRQPDKIRAFALGALLLKVLLTPPPQW